jgi:hypothetical protein
MNSLDLAQILKRMDIRNDSYDLRGGLPNEAMCLNKNGQAWEVYYSERGQKSNLQSFNSEDVACKYLLGTLVSMFY